MSNFSHLSLDLSYVCAAAVASETSGLRSLPSPFAWLSLSAPASVQTSAWAHVIAHDHRQARCRVVGEDFPVSEHHVMLVVDGMTHIPGNSWAAGCRICGSLAACTAGALPRTAGALFTLLPDVCFSVAASLLRISFSQDASSRILSCISRTLFLMFSCVRMLSGGPVIMTTRFVCVLHCVCGRRCLAGLTSCRSPAGQANTWGVTEAHTQRSQISKHKSTKADCCDRLRVTLTFRKLSPCSSG